MVKILSSVILAGIVCVSQAGPDTAAHQLQAIYDKANGLKVKKDVKGLTQLLKETRSSDFLFYGRSGKSTLEDVIKGMTSVMALVDKVSRATVHIDKLETKDSTAVATISTVFVFVSKPLDDHHAHVFSEQIIGQDTWSNSSGKWKLTMSKTTTEHFLRDGRPLRI